ncbi:MULTISPECIES: hypothetical protein [unclassified Rhizobium]|uniref:hypothetical protein n=1 Tax=unclassified Rhizobium TaxID=2613769 RepID=UPI000A5CF38A|nr:MULTISPECIES: hypothetical protein [unclassified Rhizobium]
MSKICELNEWGYSSEEWSALGWRKRSRIRNWSIDRLSNWEWHREYKRIWVKRNPEKVKEAKRRHYDKLKRARVEAAAADQAARESQRDKWIAQNQRALSKEPLEVYRRVIRAISKRGYPPDVQDDIASEMILSLMQGDIPLSEIEVKVNCYARDHYRQREWKQTISLDAPNRNDDGNTTFGDTIEGGL